LGRQSEKKLLDVVCIKVMVKEKEGGETTEGLVYMVKSNESRTKPCKDEKVLLI